MRKTIIAIVAALALAGCSEPGDDLDPIIKQTIDDVAEDGDCDALQASFDLADRTNDIDRMEYVDHVMEEIGCYG